MSLRKRPGSPYWQYDFVLHGRRFAGSTKLRSKRDAEAFVARIRADALLPARNRPPITLDTAAGLYSDHAETLPSWPTVEPILAAMVTGLGGGHLLSEIGQDDLRRYFAKRRNGRKNSSVNREIDIARAMWRKAETNRFDVGEMPDWKALRLKVPARPPRELSEEEEARLFSCLRADLRDATDFALKSGWRKAEVLGLLWADVDLKQQQAITRIKGGDTVVRPLNQTLCILIANQPRVGPYVWTYVCQQSRAKRRKGQRYPLTPTALRKGWDNALKDAGIEGFRFHDLRHTRGTRIVRATGSLAAAKKALAHRSLTTTLRYSHVLDDDLRNALDASESRTIPALKDKAG
jgi:integrase